MAYSVTGTSGNDTLDQSADAGPGTIVGLAGNDRIRTGTGAVTVDGGSGEDNIVLQAGNTGTVTGGSENDSVSSNGFAIGSMLLLGNEGADTILGGPAVGPLTIQGGNDSADGGDLLAGGSGDDIVFGNGGQDSLTGLAGNDTLVGGFNNDSIFHPDLLGPGGDDLVFGNEGDDTINVFPGNDTIFAGQGNDFVFTSGVGRQQVFGNEGNDTIIAAGNDPTTILGGNDSADGADRISGGTAGDIIFGNGGADSIFGNGGDDTIIGGFTADLITTADGNDFIFGNEGNDTINTGGGAGADTVFAGQGDDTVVAADSRDALNGNEGNDTIRGGLGIDTISGGGGADLFAYGAAADDGNNANGGGPVETITDLNWAEDRFQVFATVSAANNVGAINGANLEASAEAAIQASLALAGGGAQQHVAAQFTFGGRTYAAIDQGGNNNLFTDSVDLLIDITGAAGTVSAANFTT
jgi:Ca2+-binding RTX toxin-like protein